MAKNNTISRDVSRLIDAYNLLVGGIDSEAQHSEDRAYGGIVRAGKGILVESLARNIIEIAWKEIGGKKRRLSLERKSIKIPLNKTYLDKIKSQEVRDYIRKNIKDFYYLLKTDVHVCIDNEFAVGVECKAYTENAMLKRILVDFTLLKQVFPKLQCVLLQLESQLGGDYSIPGKDIILGSHSTHTLMSYFDVDLAIITLLEGERKIDRAIHKKEFFKDLKPIDILRAVDFFKTTLRQKL